MTQERGRILLQGRRCVWLAALLGRLTQLVECLAYNEGVGGSSPSSPTSGVSGPFSSRFSRTAATAPRGVRVTARRPGRSPGPLNRRASSCALSRTPRVLTVRGPMPGRVALHGLASGPRGGPPGSSSAGPRGSAPPRRRSSNQPRPRPARVRGGCRAPVPARRAGAQDRTRRGGSRPRAAMDGGAARPSPMHSSLAPERLSAIARRRGPAKDHGPTHAVSSRSSPSSDTHSRETSAAPPSAVAMGSRPGGSLMHPSPASRQSSRAIGSEGDQSSGWMSRLPSLRRSGSRSAMIRPLRRKGGAVASPSTTAAGASARFNAAQRATSTSRSVARTGTPARVSETASEPSPQQASHATPPPRRARPRSAPRAGPRPPARSPARGPWTSAPRGGHPGSAPARAVAALAAATRSGPPRGRAPPRRAADGPAAIALQERVQPFADRGLPGSQEFPGGAIHAQRRDVRWGSAASARGSAGSMRWCTRRAVRREGAAGSAASCARRSSARVTARSHSGSMSTPRSETSPRAGAPRDRGWRWCRPRGSPRGRRRRPGAARSAPRRHGADVHDREADGIARVLPAEAPRPPEFAALEQQQRSGLGEASSDGHHGLVTSEGGAHVAPELRRVGGVKSEQVVGEELLVLAAEVHVEALARRQDVLRLGGQRGACLEPRRAAGPSARAPRPAAPQRGRRRP